MIKLEGISVQCNKVPHSPIHELTFLLMYADYQPSDAEVKQLVDDTEKFALANHIFWGLWGLISVCVFHFFFFSFCYFYV